MISQTRRPLRDIVGASEKIHIIDVGARATVTPPPYEPLLANGSAEVLGFDLSSAAVQDLNSRRRGAERYLPFAIGDGAVRPLYICADPEMTSLLEPNNEVLNLFGGFPKWGTVERTETVKTVRLDDVAEITAMDYLKIDVQGAELLVLQNAPRRLSSSLIVQAEVSFLPMYRGQPLFSDVEQFLRTLGFSLYKLLEPHSCALAPLLVNSDHMANYGQLFWSDAVFVRDLTKIDALTEAQILKLATIAHDVYQAFDLALFTLTELDQRSGTRHAAHLLETLAS